MLEKGGVNISIINGVLPPKAVQQMRADHAGLETVAAGESLPYAVVGLSIVLHPNNPMAPTCHFNFRYFETYDPKDLTKPVASWFGSVLALSFLSLALIHYACSGSCAICH